MRRSRRRSPSSNGFCPATSNSRREVRLPIFRIRFQQLTGPLMAKSVEDTLFFRQHTALALNEVGAERLPRAFSVNRFHREMQARFQRQPDALSTTSRTTQARRGRQGSTLRHHRSA